MDIMGMDQQLDLMILVCFDSMISVNSEQMSASAYASLDVRKLNSSTSLSRKGPEGNIKSPPAKHCRNTLWQCHLCSEEATVQTACGIQLP